MSTNGWTSEFDMGIRLIVIYNEIHCGIHKPLFCSEVPEWQMDYLKYTVYFRYQYNSSVSYASKNTLFVLSPFFYFLFTKIQTNSILRVSAISE